MLTKTIKNHNNSLSETSFKTLKNTYLLLTFILGITAIFAKISMSVNISHILFIGISLASFAFYFITFFTSQSSLGLLSISIFSCLEGFSLGPILNHYMGFSNGSQLIFNALAITSLIFLILSAFVIATRKDFSFLQTFLAAGIIIVIIGCLVNLFCDNSYLFLTVNIMTSLLMAGYILYHTSEIINKGETNYIRVTILLYLDFINLFISVLNISGQDNN